jgi:SAM-dependent methyltransferase
MNTPEPITRAPTVAEAQSLRSAFAAAGFEDAAVCERLGISSIVAVETLHGAWYLRRLQQREPLGALIRLFLLQRPAPAAELRPAFGEAEVALLVELGLVERAGGDLLPRVDLYPYEGDLFATDRGDRAGEGDAEAVGRYDAVMPLNMSSHTLAQLALARPVEAALDVGTGCGVHAVRAARRAARVVATDLNPRALQFAAFNAALNGVLNIEFRLGSLWEPVAGERFDHILANPAFSLSAEHEFLFRDGGERGDRMTAALVAGAAERLREGGIAQVIGEFPTIGESGFEEQIEAWVGDAACDLLLLRMGAMEPLEYAAAYAHQPFGQSREAYEAALNARLAAFAAMGAQDVALGAVLMRRRAAGPHWAARRVLPAPERAAGEEIGQLITRLDRWSLPEAAQSLWLGKPRIVPGVQLTETRGWEKDGWVEGEARAGIPELLLCRDVRLSGPARDLLALCDGARTGAEIAAEFARDYGLAVEEAAETTLAFLRELAEQGLIEEEGGEAGTALPDARHGAATGRGPA